MSRMINSIKKNSKALGIATMAFISMIGASFVHAAADTELVAAASTTATTVKENVVAGIYAVLPIVSIVLALFITIYAVVRFVRRMAK